MSLLYAIQCCGRYAAIKRIHSDLQTAPEKSLTLHSFCPFPIKLATVRQDAGQLHSSVRYSIIMYARFFAPLVAVFLGIGPECAQAAIGPTPAHDVHFRNVHQIQLSAQMSIGYSERMDRFMDGSTKRSTVLFAGNHLLTIPVSIRAMNGSWVVVLVIMTCAVAWRLRVPILHLIQSSSSPISEPCAVPEPPPSAAVLESSDNMNTKPQSETPVNGGNR